MYEFSVIEFIAIILFLHTNDMRTNQISVAMNVTCLSTGQHSQEPFS